MAAFVVGFLVLAVVGCDAPETRTDGTVRVYTTLPVVEYVLRQVAGRSIEVGRLLQPGSSAHSYEPRPSDARAVADAALVVYAADHLDRWAARTTAARRLELMSLLPDSLRYYPSERHGVADPHFWLDPMAMRTIVRGLPPVLCDLLPSDCEAFRSNADAADNDLLRLHDEIRGHLSAVQQQTHVMATPFFGYFARRYGLRVAGVIGVTEVLDSGPRQIADLVRALKNSSESVDAVICEAGESQVAAEMLADLLAARLVAIDAVGGAPGRETYRELMLYNVRQLLGENL